MSAPRITFNSGVKTPESTAPKITFGNGVETPESRAPKITFSNGIQNQATAPTTGAVTPARKTSALKNVTTLPVLDDIKQDITQTVRGAAANQELGRFGAGNGERTSTGAGRKAGKSATAFDVAKNAVDTGLNQFNSGLAKTLDFILPTEFLGEHDPVSKLNDYYSGKYERAQQELERSTADKGKAAQVAGQVAAGIAAAVPNAILALMSGGTSAAAQGTTAGLEAASAAANSGGLLSTIGSTAQQLVKNPMYWSSVSQTLGTDYEDAKADGASETEAIASAFISSLLNAGVEVGGGIETLPAQLQNGSKSAVREWVKSALDEGKEEVVQDIISGLTQKAIYDHDKKYVSAEDNSAVINPYVLGQDFAMGAAVGGILGGAQTGINSALNATARNRITPMPGSGIEGAQSIDRTVTELPRVEQVNTDTAGTESAAEGVQGQNNTASTGEPFSRQAQNALSRLSNGETVRLEELYAIPEIAEVRAKDVSETADISTPEREMLRENTVQTLYRQGSFTGVEKNGDGGYNGTVKRDRRADIVIGAPAAGKSSVLVNPLSQAHGSRVIDSDMAKALLPEYDNGKGASAVHKESSGIRDRLLTMSVANGDNIVWPQVGRDLNGLVDDIQLLKKLGYQVYLHLNELPAEKATGRAINRFLTEGRYIDPGLVLSVGDTPTRNYHILRNTGGLLNGYSHYSNDVAYGERPILIESEETPLVADAGGYRGRREVGDRSVAQTGDGDGKTQSTGQLTESVDGYGRNTVGSAQAQFAYKADIRPEVQKNVAPVYGSPANSATYQTETETTFTDPSIFDNSSGVNRNSAQTSQNDASNKRFAMSADGLVDEVVSGDYGRNTVGSAEAVSPYQEAPTQSVADRMFTEQEMQKHDLESKHQVYSNKQSRYDAAVMLDSDYEGEVERLKADEWGPAENVEGHMILENLVKQARRTGADEDWAKVKEWKQLYDRKGGTEAGQTLQSRAQFTNSAANLTAEAADFLDSDKAKKLNREKRTAVIDSVADQSEALENIPEGDTGALIDLIKRNSEIRRTTGLFSKKTSKQMNWALNYIADNVSDGEAFLRGVAADQIRSIPLDYSKTSFTERAKSLRVQFMLSKISTIMRNLASNNVFDPLETLSNDTGLVADLLMSKVTGQRTTAFEKSWLSKAKRHGSLEGALKSFVEVGLDADSAGSKYEGTGGRTFKMTGNPLERFLSTWSKFQNYTLTTTDEFQKGGIRAETQESIDKLKRSGKLDADSLSEWADETAKQRTFQNDSKLAKSVSKAKQAANDIVHIGDIGAGDILVPFAKVPSNLVTQAANYSPVGMINGLRQTVEVMIDSKKGNYSAEKQAQAARNFGRGLTGTGLLAAFTAFALKGVIDVAGDDDKDKEALERAQGRTGTQWNLSATLRLLNGGSGEWRDGDTLMSIGFLDPLNSIMAAGALIADEYEEDGSISAGDVMKASLGAVWQSVLDLPAMSSINDLMTTYEYAEGDILSDKLINAGLDYAGGELESFVVPNFLRGIATGLDDTVRNRYGGETIKETTADGIKSGLPVFRESLPASLDPFGREKTQTGNTALNILNNNLLPGALTKYKETDVEKTLEDVYEATGNAAVYPDRKAPSSFSVDNQKYTLDQEMKDEFMTTAGETALEIMMDLIDSESFQRMNEETQGQYLALANEYARAVAKVEVTDGKYELTGTNKKIAAAEDAGLSAADYIMYKLDSEAYNEDGEGAMKISEVAAAIQNSGMSEKEQTAYWLVSYPEWPEKAEEKGVDIEDYIKYKQYTYGVEGDKNAKGDTISESKKKNMIAALVDAGYTQSEAKALYDAINAK